MKHIIFASLLVAIGAPGAVSAWDLGPPFPMSRPFVYDSPRQSRFARQREEEMMERAYSDPRWSDPRYQGIDNYEQGEEMMDGAHSEPRWPDPRYQVIDNYDLFELAVDVPGMRMEDIEVTLEDDVLIVRGHREASDLNYRFTNSFEEGFPLDPSVDIDKFTANLKNGVLVVSAPKNMRRLDNYIRRIPIRCEDKTHVSSSSSSRKESDVVDVEFEASGYAYPADRASGYANPADRASGNDFPTDRAWNVKRNPVYDFKIPKRPWI